MTPQKGTLAGPSGIAGLTSRVVSGSIDWKRTIEDALTDNVELEWLSFCVGLYRLGVEINVGELDFVFSRLGMFLTWIFLTLLCAIMSC